MYSTYNKLANKAFKQLNIDVDANKAIG